jgi:thiol-disulfide isomerase/thioredoxin
MMKLRFIGIAALCLLSIATFAQSGKRKPVSTVVKGTMINSQRGFFIFEIQGKSDTVKLNAKGQFEILLEQHSANYFSVESNRQEAQLYILPYDTLSMTLNGVNIMDIKDLTGKSAPYCDYLAKRQLADKMFQNNFSAANLSLTPQGYFNKVDSARAVRHEAFATIKSSFMESFVETESKAINYQAGNQLLSFMNQNNKDGQKQYPASFHQYITGLPLDDENIAYVTEYRSYIKNYVSQKALERYQADPNRTVLKYYEAMVDESCKALKTQKNKSILFADIMPQILKDAGTQDLTKMIAQLEACSDDEKLIQSVKRYAAQFEHLYAGKPAPDAVAFDINGKNYKLSDFKGKVIYIDVWATWCGPCKREIPHLKTLEAEYHGKNVEFISISTDRDLNAWKNYITKESMTGLQLHQSDNQAESMSYLYMVNSIPRFILIDQNGKIVSSDAPRPSSGEQIKGMLNKLLED